VATEREMSGKHSPIPKGNNELRHPSDANWISISSRKTKVSDFDCASIVHEEVACFQVAVQYPVRMAMGNGRQKLEHKCFDLGLQEGRRHEGEEGL
jgi:hypothetical protein